MMLMACNKVAFILYLLLHKESENDSACYRGSNLSGYVGTDCMHQKVVRRILGNTHLLNNTRGHRECGNTGSTDHRVNLCLGEDIYNLCKQNAAYGIEYEGKQSRIVAMSFCEPRS